MNIKKLAVGGIVGGIIFFFLGWLIYGMLLVDFMKSNPGIVSGYEKEMPDMLYLAIGNLASGLLLAYVFIRANVTTLMGGLIMATIMGLLMSVSFDCMMYGTTNLLSKKAIMADVLAATAMFAITGAVVGLLLGKLK
jgi:hypothetical protein